MNKVEKIGFHIGAAIVAAILFPFMPRATMRAWAKVMKEKFGK